MKRQKVYVDGSGWSGSSCAICVVSPSLKKNGFLLQVIDQPIKDVLHIEYLALIKALELCKKGKYVIYTDNRRVALEMNKIKPPIYKRLYEDAMKLKGKDVEIRWCSRDENPAGLYLETRLNKLKYDYKKNRDNIFENVKKTKKREYRKRKYGKNKKK